MKKLSAEIFLAAVLLLSSLIFGGAQQTANMQNDLPRGVVIEKIACRKNAAQSYALYLPSNYTPEKKWAVLYAFDPSGDGRAPVEIFREAAERYGFIIVGSNNSRNNAGGKNLSEIIEAFWTDTRARFSIDERRVYAAGFSGGARVANLFADSCGGCIAGVVACGATFMQNSPLDKPLGYALFFAAGADDFNFAEIVETFERLKPAGNALRLDFFDGRHQWLTKEAGSDALEWFNFQAMKSGRLDIDRQAVADLFRKQTDKAERNFQKGDVLEAARAFENIIADFKTIYDTKAATEKFAEITRQKTYKKALADERESFARQRAEMNKIFSLAANSSGASVAAKLAGEEKEDAGARRAAGEMDVWLKKSKAAEDSGERRLARRILGQIVVAGFEAALYVYEPRKDYKSMTANLRLAHLANPQSVGVLYELARAYALDGKKKNAIDAVAEAVENGFSDCARLNGATEWTNLRGEKRFQELLERLKCGR